MKLILILLVSIILLISTTDGKKVDFDLKKMEGFDKMAPLRQMLKKLFQPGLGKEKSSGVKYSGVHEFHQMDIPIIGLFISGMEQPAKIPDMSFDDWFEFCWITICFELSMRVDLKEAVIRNNDDITLTSSMNGTKFHVEFNAPDVHLDAPNFIFSYNGEETMRDLDIFIKNYKVSFTGDLVMTPVGLQMENLIFEYNVDSVFLQIHDVPGQEEPYEGDLAHDLREYWESSKEQFVIDQEIWLNCFLSNGRVEWKDCPGYLDDNLYQQSFAQIIHAIGLGKMVRE